MNVSELDRLYNLYRFQKLPLKNNKVTAYAFTSRYFANADIVINDPSIEHTVLENYKKEVSALGFNINIRAYTSLEEAEKKLFEGFFDPVSASLTVKKSYEDYKNKITDVIFSNYTYICSEYYDAQLEEYKNDNIVDKIVTDFSAEGPVLVVLEAAAGFGKTSTSFEVLNKLTKKFEGNKIPLFIELSRNRQAPIFKYVLYDEIERKFTGISLELVRKHIIEGRIPVIIDGFDELLKSTNKDKKGEKFEEAEPMLDTIRELLQIDAKIILTTRKTAIFDGDDFHTWIEKNSSSFEFRRYSLSSPTIKDWIDPTREKALQRAGLNLKSISNPVLLSYLRNMSEKEFTECLKNTDLVIEGYIEKLLNREKERQALIMANDEQENILELVSTHFVLHDITSESKDVLEKLIFSNKRELLFSIVKRYPASDNMTIDSLTAKLTMHAFLDRKGESEQKIGFVNDFILGTFVGKNLINDKDEWICTERFVDFLLTAYTPRNTNTKNKIYDLINDTLFDILPSSKRIFIDNYLKGGINHDLSNEYIEGIEFRNTFHFNKIVENCIFLDCEFYNIELSFETFRKVNFINCAFIDCNIHIGQVISNEIDFTNCKADPNFLINYSDQRIITNDKEVEINSFEKHVLERFWPAGRDRFTAHKREGTLRMGVPSEEVTNIDLAIDSLIKRGIIIKERGKFSVELNIEHIKEIKQILGR
ncbi:hypothetical protein CLV51_105363 [Chitinophaga niastensis]|uniref:NACHT-associated inactive Restriction Endonuclease 2 domain-containing protein n=1 Tax=Chitinophaga niastensis TaxID=536980 RepID=A0A2P8HFH9_CHINA|nr:hypothetical protein [Chitinophaga niastensis]PSL44988.1 hypothetical protein CLV51_105363 [Chitinophaga niastensis]